MIEVAHRSTSLAKLESKYPNATILDLTSKAEEPWVRLSPFYPHGNIPVPGSKIMSQSVEGVWQGLKVFESEDVDPSKFEVVSMKGLKRTVRRLGPVVGHRLGTDGDTILDYRMARHCIYLPTYRWMLENSAPSLMQELKQRMLSGESFVFLDYEKNTDVDELARPLSHAGLVRAYLLDNWPQPPIEISEQVRQLFELIL